MVLASGDNPGGFDGVRGSKMLTGFRRWMSVLELNTSPRGQLLTRILIDVASSSSAMMILRIPSIALSPRRRGPGRGRRSARTGGSDDLPAQPESVLEPTALRLFAEVHEAVPVGYARSAVMCMSTVPWHAPLKISVCMVPESDPSSWGV